MRRNNLSESNIEASPPDNPAPETIEIGEREVDAFANPDNPDVMKQVLRSLEHKNMNLELKNRGLELENQSTELNIKRRSKFTGKIFTLLIGWLIMIVSVLMLVGFEIGGFLLSDQVLITLIGASTANVIGIFIIVAQYLFPRPASFNKSS